MKSKDLIKRELEQELWREPTDEEIKIETRCLERQPEEWKREITIGLYRRFSNKNLQEEIKKKGFNYKDLRKLTGINEIIMSRIVNFKQKPSEEQKIKIAIALEIPIDDIFPENYDELFDEIHPLPMKAEAKIEVIPLDSLEVLKLQAPDDYFRKAEIKSEFRRIEKIIKDLSPREQEVLEVRFGLKDGIPLSLEEAAKKLNVTRERVRQIQERALEKIKAHKDLKRSIK